MTVRAIEHIGLTMPDLEQGSTVELVTYPSAQAYESRTSLRRWRPETTEQES
jgi:hypothetical protein